MPSVREVIALWRQTVEMRMLPSDVESAKAHWFPEIEALARTHGIDQKDLFAVMDDDPDLWIEREYEIRVSGRTKAWGSNG